MKTITRKDIELALTKLPHELQVLYAVRCCYTVRHMLNEKGLACLELVELWLKDKSKVSDKDLIEAASAASASATYYAASATYYAASAAYATYTAYYAASATRAAAYAASNANAASTASAIYTAYYAANAASIKSLSEDLGEYYSLLIQMIKELTPLEILVYDIDMEGLRHLSTL